MKRALVDANLILRYLTKEPPDMAEAAFTTFAEAEAGSVCLVLIPITLAEVVWVLESYYDYPKHQIADALTEFLQSDGLDVIDRDRLVQALSLYQEKNIDFADALLAAAALSGGPDLVYSFDRHFDRIPGVTRLEPGKSA